MHSSLKTSSSPTSMYAGGSPDRSAALAGAGEAVNGERAR